MPEQETVEAGRSGRQRETDAVLDWRATELARAGYDDLSAWTLATTADVDLHQAVALLQRGCPVRTALRILL